MLKKLKVFACCLPLLLTACATTEQAVRDEAGEITESVRVGPQAKPIKAITSFTDGLRCMDNLFLMYGVRDVVVIAEDLNDETKKVSTGTRDMLITSVSEMTKRSKAVRLIAYGADSSNLIGFMKESESKNMFQLVPEYGIRGSISQFDENVAKKTEGGGIALDTFGGFGRAATASTTILGLDLTMMRTADLSILSGVTSSNTVAIFKSGSGLEGEAGYSKFGINYQSNLSRSEGTAQAVRNLVDMAAIELFGKLTRTPYWVCLGATSEIATVKNEISDWYASMNYEGEVIAYWQRQMRIRGLYTGEINGQSSDELIRAITAYREAMGLEKSAVVDLAFFTAYLDANHYDVTPKAREILVSYQMSAEPAAQAEPIKLAITSSRGRRGFNQGEQIQLSVQLSRDAYVYCFMRDENQTIARFYPNRFTADAWVRAAAGIKLPQDKEFNIYAGTPGSREQIVCFASDNDVYPDVLPVIGGGDIDTPTSSQSLPQIVSAFEQAAGANMGMATFVLTVR